MWRDRFVTERLPHASIEEIDASSARAPALLDSVLGQMIGEHGKFERQYGYGYVHQMMAWARRYRNGRGLYSVRLCSESRFIFPLGDEFWSEMLLFRGHYESELA
jgi:hypothetical protein